MRISQENIGHALFGFSVAMFVVSLSLPVFFFEHRDPLFGYQVLLWGWWGALVFEFGWFANVAYFFGVRARCVNEPSRARLMAAIAFGLGISSLHAKEWWFSEAAETPITGYGLEFHAWMLSFVFLFVWAFFSWQSYEDVSVKDN